MRTMTARYRGTCAQCAAPIAPGDEITQHARRVTTHAGACADDLGSRRPAPSWKQRYGRCEDAPCCGCCS